MSKNLYRIQWYLKEALRVGNEEDEKKLKKRIYNGRRIADECRAAADKAKEKGMDAEAKELIATAEEIEDYIENYDFIDFDDDGDEAGEKDSQANNDGEGRDPNGTDKNKANKDGDDDDGEDDEGDDADEEGDDDGDGDENDDGSEKSSKSKSAKGDDEDDDSDSDSDGDGDGDEGDSDEEKGSSSSQDKEKNQEHSKRGVDRLGNVDQSGDYEDQDGNHRDGSSNDSGEDQQSSRQNGQQGQQGQEQSQQQQNQQNGKGDSQEDQEKKDPQKGKGKGDPEQSPKGDKGDKDEPEDDDPALRQPPTPPFVPRDKNKPIRINPKALPPKEIINDPFEDYEDLPVNPEDLQKLLQQMGNQQPLPPGFEPPTYRDPTVEEIGNYLNHLEGKAKDAAKAAIKDLIAKKGGTTESLTEAKKRTLRDLEDQEWNDLCKKGYDLIKKVVDKDAPDIIDDIDEKKKKVQQINRGSLGRELDAENKGEKKDDPEADNEDEIKKYGRFRPLQGFELEFYDVIKQKVEMVEQEYQSYDEINPEYEFEMGSPIVKADLVRLIPEEAKPIVRIYVDQSSSWSKEHIKMGKHFLSTINDFVESGEVYAQILYFDNRVTPDEFDPRLGHGSTDAWPYIIQDIIDSGAQYVVVMTDHDMDYDAYKASTTVEGWVWWVWKSENYGDYGTEIPKRLVGLQGNSEFALPNNR